MASVTGLAEQNGLLAAWIDTQYHATVHSETGQPPLHRWQAGMPAPCYCPHPPSWPKRSYGPSAARSPRPATVSLHGNTYLVDPALAGRHVKLTFDPFNLTRIDVRHAKQPAGTATPLTIGRHAHPKALPEHHGPSPAEPTGIDYLRFLHDTREPAGL